MKQHPLTAGIVTGIVIVLYFLLAPRVASAAIVFTDLVPRGAATPTIERSTTTPILTGTPALTPVVATATVYKIQSDDERAEIARLMKQIEILKAILTMLIEQKYAGKTGVAVNGQF